MRSSLTVNNLRSVPAKPTSKYKQIPSVKNKQKEECHGAVGRSTQIRALFLKLIKKVASTPATVLIQGETGTGKEVVAWSILESSNRKDKPFVVLDCSAIPKNLVESSSLDTKSAGRSINVRVPSNVQTAARFFWMNLGN